MHLLDFAFRTNWRWLGQVRRVLCLLILAGLLGGLPALHWPTTAFAQGIDDSGDSVRGTLSITSSRGETVHLPGPAASIFVADPNIADFQAPKNDVVFVFGKKSGRTSLFALDDSGKALAEFEVIVTQPIEDLRSLLRSQMGEYPVKVSYTPRGAVLSGTVPSADVADEAKAITEQFLGAGAVIVNKMQVAGSLQVNLSVRVAEVSRSAMKQLGINLSAVGRSGNFIFDILNGAGSGSGAAQGGGSVGVGFLRGATNINAVIDALANEELVSVLAEPNLTAVSGESASFLAGGEFPIPISQGDGQVTVEFRRFGVSLEFIPTVMSNNLINVRVKPEVSELSAQGAVVVNGLSVPALSTRRADTVVELGSGQSFAIGGLIRRNFTTSVSAFPWLGQLPVLGALFRSSNFQKNESELVIIVTPYIVRPSASPDRLSTPADRSAPPTDAGRIFINKLAKHPPGRPAGRAGQARFIIE
ncbi:type II and III secretion system protein family protein [Terrihabitans sp. B22-R8]|uniref:type II and III secretion system protein family protein n=1 Tax=Terrihabitans sp. B22-R8 TaxID=3425128 RepID=UPI00403CA9D4